nr:hypothetical protein [Blautia sp. OF03-13]
MKSLGVYLKHYKKESIIAPLFKLLEVVFDLLVPMVVARSSMWVSQAITVRTSSAVLESSF